MKEILLVDPYYVRIIVVCVTNFVSRLHVVLIAPSEIFMVWLLKLKLTNKS